MVDLISIRNYLPFSEPVCFMSCRRETVEKGVPARHREPARSGEAGGPPGNRRGLDPNRT